MNQIAGFSGIKLCIIFAVFLLAHNVSANESGRKTTPQGEDPVQQSGKRLPDFIPLFKLKKISVETPDPFVLFTQRCYDACTAERENCRKKAIDKPPTGGWAVHYLNKCNREYRMCLLNCDREHQVK